MKQNLSLTTGYELTTACKGVFSGADFDIFGVSIDTRTLQKGDVFFALPGKNIDGEEFLPQALEKGAVAAVVSRFQDQVDLPQIIVSDVLQALKTLSEIKRAKSNTIFIGITGSNGKTTTKEMTAHLLSQLGKTHATRGNLNNDIGVPLTLANLRGDERFATIEMGANHLGEIADLCEIVRPHFGVITSIGAAHLQGFGSLEGVITTKEALFNAAAKVIINLDAPVNWLQKYEQKTVATFSLSNAINEQTLVPEEISAAGDSFVIKGERITWKLLGKHNVSNALAAIAIAHECGLDYAACARTLSTFHVKNSRLNVYKYSIHTLIDDSYNANPASFTAALQTLKNLSGDKTVFAGAMFELGDEAAVLHQEIRKLAQKLDFTFVAVNTDLYGVEAISKTVAREQLFQLLQKETPQSVLIKGSRSAKMEELITLELREKLRE